MSNKSGAIYLDRISWNLSTDISLEMKLSCVLVALCSGMVIGGRSVAGIGVAFPKLPLSFYSS